MEGSAIGGQEGGVDGIGLGAQTLSVGKVAGAGRLNNADGDARLLQGTGGPLFIPPGGLTNDMNAGVRLQAFDKLGMTFWIIGPAVGTSI